MYIIHTQVCERCAITKVYVCFVFFFFWKLDRSQNRDCFCFGKGELNMFAFMA